jgi:tetratricopeptide (TPR) repeat protein
MRGSIGTLLLLAMMVGGPVEIGASPSSEARIPEATLAVMRELAKTADQSDCTAILKVGNQLLAEPHLSAVPAEFIGITHGLMGTCSFQEGDEKAGYAAILKATSFELVPDDNWSLRLGHELNNGMYEAAVSTIEAMSKGHGESLNNMQPNLIYRVHRELKKSGQTELRRRLLKVVASEAYAPLEHLGEMSEYYPWAYAQLLHDVGDKEAANAIVLNLREPAMIMQASLDPRSRQLFPEDFDIRQATEASLARRRASATRHPYRLLPLLNVAGHLRDLGRDQEAIELLLPLESRVTAGSSFVDRDDWAEWYWDALARSYTKLGRYDEAVAAFGKGGALDEHGNPNVSQLINLAAAQTLMGRPQDTLETLRLVEGRPASPYGVMEMHTARVCALALLGRHDETLKTQKFAEAREEDNPQALTSMMLCLGHMDKAAAAFVRQLENPERRVGALLQLSDYDARPPGAPQWQHAARIEQLKARPDVKQAIARAGGTRRFNIQYPGL